MQIIMKTKIIVIYQYKIEMMILTIGEELKQREKRKRVADDFFFCSFNPYTAGLFFSPC